jgi:hypothetical protein
MADIAFRHGDLMTAAEQMIGSVLKQKLPQQDNLTVVLLEVSHRRPIGNYRAAVRSARGAPAAQSGAWRRNSGAGDHSLSFLVT